MRQYKPKYSYNQISEFIEIAYSVMKDAIHPNFPPLGLHLVTEDKVLFHYNKKLSSYNIATGRQLFGFIEINPNSFIEYDEVFNVINGYHISKAKMKGYIIKTVAHEISHVGQRIKYYDIAFDDSNEIYSKLENTNEFYTCKWLSNNAKYLYHFLGEFEIENISKNIKNITLNDFEFLQSWNEKLLDELDLLFFYDTINLLKYAIEKGLEELSICIDNSCWKFQDEDVLYDEDVAKTVLTIFSQNIKDYRTYLSKVDVCKNDKSIIFTLIEDSKNKKNTDRDFSITHIDRNDNEKCFIDKFLRI